MNPITCEIDPSNRCQNNCSFCMFAEYRKKNRVDMPVDLFRELVIDLKRIGVRSITFTGGGEPLMNPDFNYMAWFARELGFKIGLITNGIDLHELKDPTIFEFIRVSLDAATPKTYLTIKKNDAFGRVIKNIEALPMVTGVSFVVTEQNKHETHSAQRLMAKLGVRYIQFKPVYGATLKETPEASNIIRTDRYKITSSLPCHIAGLVGVVGADGNVWYCCQKRGQVGCCLGSLQGSSFSELWAERTAESGTENCKTCRYQNYIEEMYNPAQTVRHKWFM